MGEGAQEPDAGQEPGPLGRVERRLRRRRGRGGHAVDRGGVIRDEPDRAGEEIGERAAADHHVLEERIQLRHRGGVGRGGEVGRCVCVVLFVHGVPIEMFA